MLKLHHFRFDVMSASHALHIDVRRFIQTTPLMECGLTTVRTPTNGHPRPFSAARQAWKLSNTICVGYL